MTLRILGVLVMTALCFSSCRKTYNYQETIELADGQRDTLRAIETLKDELAVRVTLQVEETMEEENLDTTVVIIDSLMRVEEEELVVSRYYDTLKPNRKLRDVPTDTLIEALEKLLTVYDTDDRIEPYLETDSVVMQRTRVVLAMFESDRVEAQTDGSYKLTKLDKYDKVKGIPLCDKERFRGQVCGAKCAAFAISDRLIVTAAHCVAGFNNDTIGEKVKFVFGFQYTADNVISTSIKNEDVYIGQTVELFRSDTADFAIVEVDHAIPPERISSLSFEKMSIDDPVYSMGFPMGLPLKIAKKGFVKSVDTRLRLFRADLDLYRGTSGSPVFNSAGDVVGIVQGGSKDVVASPGNYCMKSKVCKKAFGKECIGETIFNNKQYLRYLKKPV